MSWGSAFNENAKSMDSIEGRVAAFKSAFESLSLDLISSDFIKNVISAGTAIVKFADSDLGQATIKMMAFIGVAKLFGSIKIFGTFATKLKSLGTQIAGFATITNNAFKSRGITAGLSTMAKGFGALGASLLKVIGPANLVIAALTALGFLFKSVRDEYKKDEIALNEQKEVVANLSSELETLKGQYETLSSATNLSEAEKQKLKYLELQIKANEILIQQEAKKQYQAQYNTDKEVQVTAYGRGKVDYGGPIYKEGSTGLKELQDMLTESENLQKSIIDTRNEIANLDPTTADFTDRMAELTEKIKADEEALGDLQNRLGPAGTEFYDLLEKMNPSDIDDEMAETRQRVLDAMQGFYDLMHAAGEAGDALTQAGAAFAQVDGYIEGASAALTNYKEALEAGSSDQYFQGYTEAWKTLNEEIKNGTVNSREALESAKLIFGQDALREAGYHVETLVNNAKYLPTIFGDAESSGAGLIKVLDSMTNSSGEILSNSGEVIGHLQKLSDGTIDLDIPNENFGKLAEILGMDEDALISVLEALTQIGDFSLLDVDKMIDKMQELGKVAEVSGKKAISLDEYNRQTANFANNTVKVAQFDQQLAQAGVAVIDFAGDLNKTLSALKDFGVAKEDASGKFDIDYSTLKNFMLQLGYSSVEADNFARKLQDVNNVNLNNVNGQLDTTASKVGQLANMKVANPFAMVAQLGQTAIDQIKSVKKTEDELEGLNKVKTNRTVGQINNIQTAANNAANAVIDVVNNLNNIPKNIPINISVNGSSVGGSSKSGGGGLKGLGGLVEQAMSALGRAKGDDNFQGGPALVGDEPSSDGSPRPETVIYNGQAKIVGENGPELLDIPKGAQILPYDVTKKFMDGKKVFTGTIPAFAQGTFKLDNPKLTGVYSSGDSGSKSSSSSSSKKSSSSSKASATEKENEALEKQKELYEEEIEILEHQLFLRQKNGASAAELDKLYAQIQKRLNEQANWFRQQGVEETDEMIRSIQKAWKQPTTLVS